MLQFCPGKVLGIESSCDETSAAVIQGSEVLSNVVSSQVAMHQKWGGVVPEAASRAHVEAILPVIEQALTDANTRKEEVTAIAVTNRPGLVGALSVGLSTAKALSQILAIPFLGVHHLEGHLLSLAANQPDLDDWFPMLTLIASGGHTEVVRVAGVGDYEIVAETMDDAAGEAFDKGARLMGLGYPGGYAIQVAAESGNPKRYPLPRAVRKNDAAFSFSGLKTAVLRLVEMEGAQLSVPDAAASLQAAIVESLTTKMERLAEQHQVKAIGLVGGVAANKMLRDHLRHLSELVGLNFLTPEPKLCTDNAAMIALAGSLRLAMGERSGFDLEAKPNAPLA